MRTVLVVGAALVATASHAGAQVTAGREGCTAAEAVGSIGVSLVECDCIIAPAVTGTPWRFWTEPRVMRIEEGSPAAGRLQVGDVITHVNGRAVTTEAGARALARLQPNQSVTLTVRRGERTFRQAIRSVSACPADPRLLGALPAIQRVVVSGQTGAVAEASRTPVSAPGTPTSVVPGATVRAAAGRTRAAPVSTSNVPAVAPGGPLPFAWIGIAFSCTNCAYMRSQPGAVGGRWTFSSAPEIYAVEPGSPAHAAGIRRGDILTHVDDHLITSEAGGRRWAQIRPGEKVRLRYRRGSTIRYATVQASAPPGIATTAIRAGQAPVQLRALEATLANVDSASIHVLQATERSRQEQARREAVLKRLQETQQERLRQLQQALQAGDTPEARRRVEELLRALARDQAELQQHQAQQIEALARANRLQTERLQASRDSIGRAVTALTGVYAAAVAAEQRLRYSGTFGGADIEVRSVIPIVVTETATEVTIRAGDTVVTLKRTRQ
jgi:hypothetical protein